MDDIDQGAIIRRECACPDEPSVDTVFRGQRRVSELRDRGVVENAMSSTTLYVDIVYRVLFRNANERIPIERIRAQHEILNGMFNAVNADLAYVPETGPYGFRGVQGNCELVFIPINHSDIVEGSSQVEYIQVDEGETFGGASPLLTVLSYMSDRADLDTIVDGKMNVFIAPISNSILGQAEVQSNYCVILNNAIGGPSSMGPLTSYRLGKTLVHEIGHALGLPHIFNKLEGCAAQPFADIPSQKNPVYDGVLTSSGEAYLCNRYRDCKVLKDGNTLYEVSDLTLPYSCFPCDEKGAGCTECDVGPYEQFMNVMGYSPDSSLVMFSKKQVEYMRVYLQSSDNETLTLLDRPSGADTFVIGEVEVPVEASSGDPVDNNNDDDIIGLPLWSFIAVIGGVVLLLILIWWIWRKK